MDRATPATLYCLLVGGALVLAGVLGYFWESSFETGEELVSDEAFGLLAVNGWHNVLHMALGAVLLVAAGGVARGAALAVGLIYLVLAVLGFAAEGETLFEVVPVNGPDNFLHLALGLSGLLAGLAGRG